MKYPLLTKSAFLLFATGAMAGCSDSEEGLLPSSRPAKPGETIQFGIDGPATTRTHYTEDSLQIDWDLKDKIVIYSPQAATSDGTKHEAFYMISNVYPEDDPIHQFHGDFVPVASAADNDTTENDGVGLKWTEGDGPNGFAHEAYTFYGAYPALRYQRVAEDGTFSMQYITNQVNTVVSVNNGKYETEPDMLNAYMMAKKTVKPQEDHVLLSFDPIMTTLKIDVTAGGYELGTGIIQPITVTGVSVMMQRVISEQQLKYLTTSATDGDPTASRGKLTNTIKTGQESVFVGILQDDKRYVELNEGETISLMAFLPPIKGLKMNELQVKIHTAEGFDFVTFSTSGADLKEQSRIYIHLPDVSVNDKKNNNWISQLDGNIKLTQLSIPGYDCDGSEDGEKIKKLLDLGIRVFDIDETLNNKEVKNALNTFIANNPNEFIFTTMDGRPLSIEDLDYSKTPSLDEDNWKTIKISDLRGKIISFFFYTGNYVQFPHFGDIGFDLFDRQRYFFSDEDNKNELNLNVISNDDWNVRYKDERSDHSTNQLTYETITKHSESQGCTGILMVPCADQPYVNGEYTYSDLLIQSIIDCNFKFILDRAN